MKISSSSQYLSFLVAIGIILLFIFGTEREFTMPVEKTNNYNKMMMKNNKANTIKKSIVSTLEQIAYKQWAIDSLVLVEQKYESMDSVLIERLEDIKFEFGYSNMLEKIENNKTAQLGSIINIGDQNLNIAQKKRRIMDDIDSLKNILSFHRKSLDTLRSLNRYKFYLDQPRFGN
ncbi:MAG: hypothetical protein VX279_01235 [Candidatus Neomarinimicrobiota bacterium]|nr:hypothetical protein [Candidatus Neomarinimicrobiota bacterium]